MAIKTQAMTFTTPLPEELEYGHGEGFFCLPGSMCHSGKKKIILRKLIFRLL